MHLVHGTHVVTFIAPPLALIVHELLCAHSNHRYSSDQLLTTRFQKPQEGIFIKKKTCVSPPISILCTIMMKFMYYTSQNNKNKNAHHKLAQHIVQCNKNHPTLTNLIHANNTREENQITWMTKVSKLGLHLQRSFTHWIIESQTTNNAQCTCMLPYEYSALHKRNPTLHIVRWKAPLSPPLVVAISKHLNIHRSWVVKLQQNRFPKTF